MTKSKDDKGPTAEIAAISAVYGALAGLEPSARGRVLKYASEMLGISPPVTREAEVSVPIQRLAEPLTSSPPTSLAIAEADSDDSDGISPVALKWMKRSGLTAKSLQSLFSLGIDDIDLVAKSVPGSGKKDKMRSVALLKGIAAYLGTGAARVSYEQFKEACLHYNAYDSTNFAAYLKSFSAEVGGTKESGYTLTPRGLTEATNLIQGIIAA